MFRNLVFAGLKAFLGAREFKSIQGGGAVQSPGGRSRVVSASTHPREATLPEAGKPLSVRASSVCGMPGRSTRTMSRLADGRPPARGKELKVEDTVAFRRAAGEPPSRPLRLTASNHPMTSFERLARLFHLPGGAPASGHVQVAVAQAARLTPGQRLQKFHPLERRVLEQARQLEGVRAGYAHGSVVLDVGAGTGLHAALLCLEGWHVVAIEADKSLCVRLEAETSARGLHMDVRHAWRPEAIGPVAASHARLDRVAPYLDDAALRGWLKALQGSLRRGGTLYLSTYHAAQWWNQLEPGGTRMHLRTMVALEQLTREAGLDVAAAGFDVYGGEDPLRPGREYASGLVWWDDESPIHAPTLDAAIQASVSAGEDSRGTLGTLAVVAVLLRAK